MIEIAKKLKGVFWTCLLGGFLFGIVKSIFLISSHGYLHYRMYHLLFLETVRSLNQGLLFGASAAAAAGLICAVFYVLRNKVFRSYFEIRVISKKGLKPLLRLITLVGLAGYLLIVLLQYVSRSAQPMDILLVRSLIALAVVLLVWLFMAAGVRRALSRIYRLLASASSLKLVIVLVGLLGIVNLVSLATRRMTIPQGPNVLIVVADALRADHLGCYGYPKPTSPNIDQFAQEGLVFEKAMTNAPWTKPAIASLFTSLYPHQHGALYMLDRLENSCLTLAEVFRNENYSTLGIQKNFCVDRRFNFDQGFQVFKDAFGQPDDVVLATWNAWIQKNRGRRFFAYIHFMNTHVPFVSRSEFDKRFIIGENIGVDVRILTRLGLSDEDKSHLKNLYDESIVTLDRQFKTILETLKSLKLLDNTIVVLTADHGEELWDHGSFEHGHTLYNELLQVPLIIRYPSHLPNKRVSYRVQSFDLFPSLLGLAGIETRAETQGINFIPYLKADQDLPGRELFFEGILFEAEKKAILKDGWKLIENTGEKNPEAFDGLGPLAKYAPPDRKKSYELYRQDEDFAEQNDLAASRADVVDALKRGLQSFKLLSPRFQQKIEKASRRDIEKLKSLGYIK
jgi:arylsulfatase A-like enzyme